MQTFTSGSSAEALAALEGSELLQSGCVNLISLDAVQARAAALWPRKRELVWAFTERKLNDRLASEDMVLRVSETTYLIAIACDHAAAAQSVCMRVLEEVLLHFIGHLDRADIVISRVDSISEGALSCTAVDIATIPVSNQDGDEAVQKLRPSTSRETEKNPALFSSISGRPLRVDFLPRAISSLKHGVMTAVHINRIIADADSGAVLSLTELDALTDTDIIRIDAVTMDYAKLFTMGAQAGGHAALLIPVSFRSLLNRRGREVLIANGAGSNAFKGGAVFELLHLDGGTPPSRVKEAVAIGKSMARAVFARIHDRQGGMISVAETGVAGLTILGPYLASVAASGGGRRLIQSMLRMSRTLVVLDVGGLSTPEKLLSYGFTHAGLAPGKPISPEPTPGPPPHTGP